MREPLKPLLELQAIPNSLIDSISLMANAFPPEMRKPRVVDLEGSKGQDGFTKVGPGGRSILQALAANIPVPADAKMDEQ